MKKIIDFIEENVNGRTLFTEELVYKLEDGALEGVYSDQISFSNLKYSQSGFQLDMDYGSRWTTRKIEKRF